MFTQNNISPFSQIYNTNQTENSECLFENHMNNICNCINSRYDGCVGLFPTPERQNSFDFTHDWTRQYDGALYFKKGKSKQEAADLTGRKIGMCHFKY